MRVPNVSLNNRIVFNIDHLFDYVWYISRKKMEKTVKIEAAFSISKLSVENRVENNTEIATLKDLGFEEFTTNIKTAFPFYGGEDAALERLRSYFFETNVVAF